MKKIVFGICLVLLTLCGCGVTPSGNVVRPSQVPQMWVTKTAIPPDVRPTEPLAVLSDDPWVRCEGIGESGVLPVKISDIADREYRRRVQITFMIQDADTGSNFIAERCMGGKVYVCLINGQNNCAEKLDFSVEPNQAMQTYCADTDLEGIVVGPLVSGMNSAYEWRCHEGNAVIAMQTAEADDGGYDRSIWFEIPKPE